jgi:hypothetical protein
MPFSDLMVDYVKVSTHSTNSLRTRMMEFLISFFQFFITFMREELVRIISSDLALIWSNSSRCF